MPLERKERLRKRNSERPEPLHGEDLALKSAAMFFGDELIHWLGIREKVRRIAPTELVELEVRHMYEDFLYEMENGMLYHFEFESDALTKDDLRRFREYEASTSRIYDAPVITYVICSSDVRKIRKKLTEGINTYRVRMIRLKHMNADRILEDLAGRPEKTLTRRDMLPLLFVPLMGGQTGKQERILKSLRILKRSEPVLTTEDMGKMEAILYILAVKFLNKEELEGIKEEISMTILGQMIWDDALEKGRKEGREEGREEGERQASERYSRLILLLDQENKTDQIIKIAADPKYREELYRKYGIVPDKT